MTLSTIRRWLKPYQTWMCDRRLSRAIPSYADALRAERDAIHRGCTQAISRARTAKKEAIINSMRGAV